MNELIIKEKKSITTSFVPAILLIFFALLLLYNPDNFIKSALNVFGYLGIFFGVLNIFSYFYKEKEKNITSRNIMNGTILIFYGIIAIFKADLLKNVISLLLGGYIIFQNSYRLSLSFNIFENKSITNIITLIFSIINLLLGLILALNLFIGSNSLNFYIAIIILITESLTICQNILILLNYRKKKKEGD